MRTTLLKIVMFFYLVVVAKGFQHGAESAEVEPLQGVAHGVDPATMWLSVPHVVAWYCRVNDAAGTCRNTPQCSHIKLERQRHHKCECNLKQKNKRRCWSPAVSLALTLTIFIWQNRNSKGVIWWDIQFFWPKKKKQKGKKGVYYKTELTNLTTGGRQIIGKLWLADLSEMCVIQCSIILNILMDQWEVSRTQNIGMSVSIRWWIQTDQQPSIAAFCSASLFATYTRIFSPSCSANFSLLPDRCRVVCGLWTLQKTLFCIIVCWGEDMRFVLIPTMQLRASANSRQAALTWTGPSSAGTGRHSFHRYNEAWPRQTGPFWSSCSSRTFCQSARLRRRSGECLWWGHLITYYRIPRHIRQHWVLVCLYDSMWQLRYGPIPTV